MKLSMWMIANKLNNLELELNIKNDAPAILKSARRAYATNCVHIFKSGNDVICNGEGDYIRIKDINISEAFEIVQSIFDFYDDWSDNIFKAASKYDFKRLIDYCWFTFNNPIVIIDANCRVLTISDYYGENDVDSEWFHLKKYRYSSINAIKYLRNDTIHNSFFYQLGSKYFNFSCEQLKTSCLSSSIYHNEIFCGRINVLEKDRFLNYGDIQLLNYVVSIIAPYISNITLSDDSSSIYNVFLSLINNEPVNLQDLHNQLKYIDWDNKDNYRICILSPKSDNIAKSLLTMYCGLIENHLSYIHTFIKNDSIIVIFNERKTSYYKSLDILKNISTEVNMTLSISNPFEGFNNLPIFYKQALYAYESNKINKTSNGISTFYDYAIDYIIQSSFSKEIIYACHPGILKLWKLDVKSDSSKVDTLYEYLTNERSITHTSQILYMHKNTLIYRIKKITELLGCNLDDSYTREYIMLSIKLLRLYKNKYQEIAEL